MGKCQTVGIAEITAVLGHPSGVPQCDANCLVLRSGPAAIWNSKLLASISCRLLLVATSPYIAHHAS